MRFSSHTYEYSEIMCDALRHVLVSVFLIESNGDEEKVHENHVATLELHLFVTVFLNKRG